MSPDEPDEERGGHGDEIAGQRHSIFVFVCCGGMAAVGLGWVAAKCNVLGFAPVGLLPLGIGIVLGGFVVWLSGSATVCCQWRLMLGTIALALLTVAAEHAWLYRDFCRQWREARASQAQVALFRPEQPWSPAQYFAHEATPSSVALWCGDAAILMAAAVGTVSVWRRRSDGSASQAARLM